MHLYNDFEAGKSAFRRQKSPDFLDFFSDFPKNHFSLMKSMVKQSEVQVRVYVTKFDIIDIQKHLLVSKYTLRMFFGA